MVVMMEGDLGGTGPSRVAAAAAFLVVLIKDQVEDPGRWSFEQWWHGW